MQETILVAKTLAFISQLKNNFPSLTSTTFHISWVKRSVQYCSLSGNSSTIIKFTLVAYLMTESFLTTYCPQHIGMLNMTMSFLQIVPSFLFGGTTVHHSTSCNSWQTTHTVLLSDSLSPEVPHFVYPEQVNS